MEPFGDRRNRHHFARIERRGRRLYAAITGAFASHRGLAIDRSESRKPPGELFRAIPRRRNRRHCSRSSRSIANSWREGARPVQCLWFRLAWLSALAHQGLLEWKKQSQGFLVVMFHEIWTFWPIWNKNYLLQHLHRRDLRRLLRVADVVFTSTPSQAEHLTALSPRCPIEVLPVGSNIRRVQSTAGQREPGLAVLFGLQRSRIRTLRKMLPELKALGAAGKIRKDRDRGCGQIARGR